MQECPSKQSTFSADNDYQYNQKHQECNLFHLENHGCKCITEVATNKKMESAGAIRSPGKPAEDNLGSQCLGKEMVILGQLSLVKMPK